MPPRTRAPARRRGRPAKPRFALTSPIRRRMLYNPQPVFTETYKQTALLVANAGFLLTASMDNIPQITQYTSLYQKYKILKATWLILPTYTGGTDENAAMYNNSVLPVGTVQSVGTSRLVYAINDTPAQTAPGTEAVVLQDNGCKVRFLDKKVTIHNRPVADTKDQNGIQMTFKQKYINFSALGPNVAHYGVSGFITQPLTAGAPNLQQYHVYCKLTFQLADPK